MRFSTDLNARRTDYLRYVNRSVDSRSLSARDLPDVWIGRGGEDQDATNAVAQIEHRTASIDSFMCMNAFVRKKDADMSVIEKPEFSGAIAEFLGSDVARENEGMCKIVLQMICAIWFRIPERISPSHPLLGKELFDAVYDCLCAVNGDIVGTALLGLCNITAISKNAIRAAVDRDIFSFLTRYFMYTEQTEDLTFGLRLLQTSVDFLCGCNVDLFYVEMLQMLPVFQRKLLRHPSPDIIKHSVSALLPFLRSEKGMDTAIKLGMHNEISLCVRGKIDVSFGSVVFQAVALFIDNGCRRIFSADEFFTAALAFLACDVEKDVSSVLYSVAMLADKSWGPLYMCEAHIHAIKFLEGGSFANRIAASLLLMQMIRHGHPQIKDTIGGMNCIGGMCLLLGSYSGFEMRIFFTTLLQLLDLNYARYRDAIVPHLREEDIVNVMEDVGVDTTVESLARSLITSLTESPNSG